MPAPRKYPLELMEHGVRMVIEMRQATGQSRGAVARVVKQLGVHPEALRQSYLLAVSASGFAEPNQASA